MLNAWQALTGSIDDGVPLPKIPAFRDLYEYGCEPRQGSVIMIVGRSGSQKSGLALYWVEEMGLPTLYLSADMSPFTASARLASVKTGRTTQEVEAMMETPNGRQHIQDALAGSKVAFSFDAPITFEGLERELAAYVELRDEFPRVIVVDNLMDIEGADSEYSEQMRAMQDLTSLSRDTGATVLILHHASDKTYRADQSPNMPPSRSEVKGGMSEKPELTLSVALNPNPSLAGTQELRVAVIKQRMGPSDPSAQDFRTIISRPAVTQFEAIQR